MDKVIKIHCEAKDKIALDDFIDLQGKLKVLNQEQFEKLKESITKYGFLYPMFAWRDSKGKIWTMDGHQRISILKHLRDVDGFDVPNLPTAFINAKNRREAKERLLILNSSYGKITNEGLYEFLTEANYEIDFNSIKDILDYDGINLQVFEDYYMNDNLDNISDFEDQENKLENISGYHRVEMTFQFTPEQRDAIVEYLRSIDDVEKKADKVFEILEEYYANA